MKYFVWNYTDFMQNECQAIMATTNNGQVLGIPADPLNSDYLEYVAWLFNGNTPEEWNPDAQPTESEQTDKQ
jgi:hypothetical protein